MVLIKGQINGLKQTKVEHVLCFCNSLWHGIPVSVDTASETPLAEARTFAPKYDENKIFTKKSRLRTEMNVLEWCNNS